MSNEGAVVVRPGSRVFLVDDNPAAVEPIHQRLYALGHVTTVLHDGAQVLEAARRVGLTQITFATQSSSASARATNAASR